MWIAELGLYHYNARAYAPALGRFLQTDPIGYKDGPNWYEYVGDDPVNNTDPTGLDCRTLPDITRPNILSRSYPSGSNLTFGARV